MPNGLRRDNVFSGVLGGVVVAVVVAVLLATGVVETGDDDDRAAPAAQRTEVVQPAADGGRGLTVGQIYDRVSPGVVFVSARGERESRSPFGFPQPERGVATGSGFVLDDEGNILTNAHVVEDADEVEVRFGDGEPVDAELVGTDPSTDLAVIKVDPDDAELKPLRLGRSSDAKVGDPVIAIGNPFGFDRTVTTGIVSALQRQITSPNGFAIDNVLQTDASINPGNSGGPLLDATGKVIGINSQIATSGGGSVGIGFAVPIDTAKEVVPVLEEEGEVERAFLGVTTAPVSEELADDANLPIERGALIQSVVDDGPADDAGLRGGRRETTDGLTLGGDLIVEVDGVRIDEPTDVATAIADDKPGDRVRVVYYRGDDRRSAEVRLGERPDEAQPRPGEDDDEDDGGILPLP